MQRNSGEEETREGEGTFSQVLGCLDVKDAFLQVLQGRPWKANLRGELDKELEQKHGLIFFAEYPTEELNYKLSAECPRLGRYDKTIILIHVDDLICAGDSKYINEIFLPKIQFKFDTSVSKIEGIGDELNVERRQCSLEVDGLWI